MSNIHENSKKSHSTTYGQTKFPGKFLNFSNSVLAEHHQKCRKYKLKRNEQTAKETTERSAAHSLKRSVIVKSGLRQNGGSKRTNTADRCKESWAFPALQRT